MIYVYRLPIVGGMGIRKNTFALRKSVFSEVVIVGL
nr:MAG TPA: hypothetical protein [Caudoviricetes sp.]